MSANFGLTNKDFGIIILVSNFNLCRICGGMEIKMAKGNISVDSENMFPIIKKWLYSDKDIFLRELVSNGCDAVTKLKKLAGIGEAQIEDEPKFKVTVTVYKNAKKLVISDNGIGMTAEEID